MTGRLLGSSDVNKLRIKSSNFPVELCGRRRSARCWTLPSDQARCQCRGSL
jgi:hypothetical protein